MYDYSRFWFTLLLATGAVFLTLAIVYGFQIVFGFDDGIDPRYVCIENDSFHQYPYNELCMEQKMQELMDKYYWLNSTE